jgi:hypothetical protein
MQACCLVCCSMCALSPDVVHVCTLSPDVARSVQSAHCLCSVAGLLLDLCMSAHLELKHKLVRGRSTPKACARRDGPARGVLCMLRLARRGAGDMRRRSPRRHLYLLALVVVTCLRCLLARYPLDRPKLATGTRCSKKRTTRPLPRSRPTSARPQITSCTSECKRAQVNTCSLVGCNRAQITSCTQVEAVRAEAELQKQMHNKARGLASPWVPVVARRCSCTFPVDHFDLLAIVASARRQPGDRKSDGISPGNCCCCRRGLCCGYRSWASSVFIILTSRIAVHVASQGNSEYPPSHRHRPLTVLTTRVYTR